MNLHHANLFAKQKHKGQVDDDGNDYFETHCLQVMKILEMITNNHTILMAGLLHDTLEDTDTSYEELKSHFGVTVANLVNEVTHEGKKDEIGFTFPRLKSKDAILIKFADRLSNLSRMGSWNEKRQEHYLKKSKFWSDLNREDSVHEKVV